VKTQELRLLVFLTRYIDLFTTFNYPYNSFMKAVYIVSTATIIVVIKYVDPIKSLYNAEQDSFPHWKLCVIPCTILATSTLLIGSGLSGLNTMKELLWTFSIYLESVAILPQLIVLRKYRLVENSFTS
jgi:ER lumen protein retaining receptor